MTRLISARTIIIGLLAIVTLATQAPAQFGGAGPFKMGAKVPTSVVQVLQLNPPMRLQPTKQVLPKLIDKPTLLIYVIPGNPAAEKAAAEAAAKAASWKNIQLLLAVRGMNKREIDAAIQWVQDSAITVPVVIDDSMQLALGLQAFKVPSYSMFDGQARVMVRQVSGMERKVKDGRSLDEVIADIEAGKPVPMSDGELREDTRIMMGKAIKPINLKAAPYSKGPASITIGAGAKRPTLVVFWLATCPHCQKEMPKVGKWWESNKNAVELVTITRTDGQYVGHTTKYLESKGLTDMPVYTATDDAYTSFKVEAIPTWAMLAADGTIVEVAVGEDPAIARKLTEGLKKANARQP